MKNDLLPLLFTEQKVAKQGIDGIISLSMFNNIVKSILRWRTSYLLLIYLHYNSVISPIIKIREELEIYWRCIGDVLEMYWRYDREICKTY